MIDHVMGMVLRPRRQWSLLAGRQPELGRALLYPLVMAALPALAWYYGVTEVGWRVGTGPVVRMTPDSARLIVLLFYLAQVLAVAGVGSMVHWMSSTYGAVSSSPALGIAVAGRAATPLFLAGAVGVYPIFWLDLMLGLLALAYAVYLLYTGIPAMMRVTEEQGFLFASAVLAAGLVAIMVIMGGTVMLWEWGAAPQFID